MPTSGFFWKTSGGSPEVLAPNHHISYGKLASRHWRNSTTGAMPEYRPWARTGMMASVLGAVK